MHEEGLVADSERKRAVAEAEQRRAVAAAQQESLKRMGLDRRLEQSEKRALLAELDRQVADLEGKLTAIDATVARLEHEMGLHQIRAPVGGRLGEVVPLQPGTVVEKGARLGAIVPKGEVRVVAEFAPTEALGRVRPEQQAKLRLEGFPWVQYGSVPATVVEVADETQNGKIRVELVVDRSRAFPAPLQHGLPGTLEVAVERISPAALVLRGAGRALAQPTQETAH
jgi:membrane fusion protein (multidrug efflux system)